MVGISKIFEPSCSGCNDSPIEQYQGDPYDSSNYPDCYYTGDCDGYVIYDSYTGGDTSEDYLELYELESGDYKGNMNAAEIAIYNTLTTTQKIAYLVKSQSAKDSAESSGFSGLRNGLGDAYRHCLWNLLLTKDLGSSLTKQLTDAHEGTSQYPFDYKEKQMDLYNNQVGRDLAISPGNYEENVRNAVLNGQLRYLTNLSGHLATYNSELIPTNQ